MQERNIILYETEDGKINIDVILRDEPIWLTQKSMVELFDVNIPANSKHLNNITVFKIDAEKIKNGPKFGKDYYTKKKYKNYLQKILQ